MGVMSNPYGGPQRATRLMPAPEPLSEPTRIEEFASRYVRHTIGKWAGNPFRFLPWQEQVVRTLFNTLDEHGRRPAAGPQRGAFRTLESLTFRIGRLLAHYEVPEDVDVTLHGSGPAVGIARSTSERESHFEAVAFGSRETSGDDAQSGCLDPVESVEKGPPEVGFRSCDLHADGGNWE